jgi:hypothetical protein
MFYESGVDIKILLTEYYKLFENSNISEIPSIDNVKTFKYNKEQLNYLGVKIGNSKEYLRSYVNYILDKALENYKLNYNISTTELLLSKFCTNRTGFTGTPNMHIPYDISNPIKQTIQDSNIVEIEKSIISNKETINYIDTLNIDNIINIIDEKKYSVLIDTGAFIRDDIIKNIDKLYERLILTNKFKCIVFIDNNHSKKIVYNNNGIKTYDNFSKNLNIPLKDRFYLFDHKHITGQDFIIYRKAVGLVTIRND